MELDYSDQHVDIDDLADNVEDVHSYGRDPFDILSDLEEEMNSMLNRTGS